MEQQELQRIAQLVEMNRQKMARIEEQITKLSEIRMEQLGVIAALKTLDTQQSTMIPLGGGVQLPISTEGNTVVVDIGSGVQAEKPRAEAITILESRLEEVEEVMDTLQNEFTETETVVTELANTFSEAAAAIQAAQEAEPVEESPQVKPTRRRRKHGTELTLDD
ncbi:MAG: prefoldin subunit alpha [Marine Group II euryarchaeote MED-G33]|nr:MAG: prefoldin subunit alpha [Marine Group II euryarchaeote MED-G33]|tara:strand:+ start:2295 stop:2789 length:495 start_codon:yes stop_codon:yes gene_type:complete